jgi:hypothetical protein
MLMVLEGRNGFHIYYLNKNAFVQRAVEPVGIFYTTSWLHEA